MKKDLSLILYYKRENRYSFNALAGALETDEQFDDLNIYFISREDDLLPELESSIKKYNKVVIAFSFFTSQLWDIERIIKNLREKLNIHKQTEAHLSKESPDLHDTIVFIAGGPHPTGDPEGTLRMGFDIAVVGEGEETIIELLKKVAHDDSHSRPGYITKKNYGTIKGIAFMDDDEGEVKERAYCYTGPRPPIDLDTYPPFAPKHSRFGLIEITRGCPFVCYFCQTPHIFGAHSRHRSVEKICHYVQMMYNQDLTDFVPITPNAFSYGSSDGKELNFSRLEELLRSIRKILNSGRSSGRIFFGSFPSEVRPEHVTRETMDLILRYADNDDLVIGAQSGSQRVLDLCHRGHTVEDIYNAVKLTRKAKLDALVDFIFGLPGETKQDIELTIKVIDDLVKMGAKIHAHTFMPLPTTPFAHSPAPSLGEEVRKKLHQLLPRGIAFGDWIEQEQLAKKIAHYLKTS